MDSNSGSGGGGGGGGGGCGNGGGDGGGGCGNGGRFSSTKRPPLTTAESTPAFAPGSRRWQGQLGGRLQLDLDADSSSSSDADRSFFSNNSSGSSSSGGGSSGRKSQPHPDDLFDNETRRVFGSGFGKRVRKVGAAVHSYFGVLGGQKTPGRKRAFLSVALLSLAALWAILTLSMHRGGSGGLSLLPSLTSSLLSVSSASQFTGCLVDSVLHSAPWPNNTDCPTDVRLDGAIAMCTALDQHRPVRSFADLEGHANERGAYSRHNQAYDETGQGRWYIEEQFYGFLFIQAGLAFHNRDALEVGMRIFDWGFDQQLSNGTFDCPDVYHSAGFFLEAVARAVLLLRASTYGTVHKPWLRRAERHIAAMARWFMLPEVERVGWRRDAVHTHRRYLLGTALGLAGMATRNSTLVERSLEYIRSGLSAQHLDGYNLERDGYDCSYQAIGLVYAARYYAYVAGKTVRRELHAMGRQGMAWLLTRVNPDGSLNSTGNTRTGLGQEVGRNGKPKAMATKDVVHALLYWSWILGDAEAERVAWLVEERRTGRTKDRRCDCHSELY